MEGVQYRSGLAGVSHSTEYHPSSITGWHRIGSIRVLAISCVTGGANEHDITDFHFWSSDGAVSWMDEPSRPVINQPTVPSTQYNLNHQFHVFRERIGAGCGPITMTTRPRTKKVQIVGLITSMLHLDGLVVDKIRSHQGGENEQSNRSVM